MREQHRALRMSLGRAEEWIERVADVPSRLPEPGHDVRGDVPVASRPSLIGTACAYSGRSLSSNSPRIRPGSEPANTNEATSPWNWMWLLRIASISLTFVMSWNSSRTISARNPPPSSRRNGRSSSACRAGSGSSEAPVAACAHTESAEGEPEPVLWRNSSIRAANLALELPRIGALEPHRDVGDRQDAVQVDEDRDHPLLLLPVAQHPPQKARLPELPRREQTDVMAADCVREQALRLLVPVDDFLRRDRVGVDERVDVGDHRCRTSVPMRSVFWHRSVPDRARSEALRRGDPVDLGQLLG